MPSGTSIYYLINLSSSEISIKGSTVISGDRDCIWPTTNSKEFIEISSKTKSKKKSNINQNLEVSIWKSVMRVFDSQVAKCVVNLKPLLYYPNISTER